MPEGSKIKIERSEPIFRQVADAIERGILDGTYQPGSQLPSEPRLAETFDVSRVTIRSALRELRTRGLILSEQGRGSFVLTPRPPDAALDASITLTPDGDYQLASLTEELEAPAITRTLLVGSTARFLGVDPSDEGIAFRVQRLLQDPATKARAAHELVIPFDVAADTDLGDEPPTDPGALFSALAAAGHPLSWWWQVTARSPVPDERETLRVPPTGNVLVATRVTLGQDDRPLVLETLALSATAAQLGVRVPRPGH